MPFFFVTVVPECVIRNKDYTVSPNDRINRVVTLHVWVYESAEETVSIMHACKNVQKTELIKMCMLEC